MSWEINDAPSTTYEVTDMKIDELPQPERERDTGKLYLIGREGYRLKPRSYLPSHLIQIHKQLISRYGIGTIVPFSELAIFLQMGKFPLRTAITRLWIDGYLNKYAKGKYGAARSNWKGKKNNWRGQYFGVHYEIVDKPYR